MAHAHNATPGPIATSPTKYRNAIPSSEPTTDKLRSATALSPNISLQNRSKIKYSGGWFSSLAIELQIDHTGRAFFNEIRSGTTCEGLRCMSVRPQPDEHSTLKYSSSQRELDPK